MVYSYSGGAIVDEETIELNEQGEVELAEDLLEDIFNYKLEIIEIQANATLTPIDHDTTISDTFSDSDGYNDTVDTGNTTASFSTNKYARTNSSDDNADLPDSTGVTGNEYSVKAGVYLSPATSTQIRSVVKQTNSTDTIAYVYERTGDTIGTLLGSATFIGDTASFSTPISVSSGSDYFVLTDKGGSTRYVANGIASGFPYDSDGLNVTANYHLVNRNSQTNANQGIVSISYGDAAIETSKVIRLDLPPISGTVTHTQLVLNDPDRETGDNITYSLIDTDTTEQTGLEIDEKNIITTVDGAKLSGGQLEIQLVPNDTNPTNGYPSVQTYCLKIWKA
jgi:hypothetical protein